MTRSTAQTAATLTVIALLVPAAAVSAQDQDTVRAALRSLTTGQAVQADDVARDREAAETARDAIARALVVNLTTAPIGTSSGGFQYRLNPELGTVERVSQNFGTFFVERALIIGAGSTSLGMTTSTAGYDRLNGYALGDGSLVTAATHVRGEALADAERLTMRLRASTMAFFATVGVADQAELGIVVPVTRISLDGTRWSSPRGTPLLQANAAASASGLGDIAIRGKYGLVSSRTFSLAATGELRLPTGSQENLLGAGSPALRVLGVASFESGPAGLHLNGGFDRGGISDEINMAVALAVAVHPRATLTTEVMRRRISELRPFELTSAAQPGVDGADIVRLTAGLDAGTAVTAATGVKWNVSDTLVLSGQILWCLNDRGLTAPATPTVSLEYLVW
jgi:hypothetical protein